ncbi:MAG: hypothetical protein AAFO95_12120 [Cyanobacteria bacterium J06600_6]
MKQIEKLVVGLLILKIASYLFGNFLVAASFKISSLEIADIGIQGLIQSQYIEPIQLLIRILLQFGLAVWIYFRVNGSRQSKWIWSLFSLCFGIYGVTVYFLKQLVDHKLYASNFE